MARALVYHMDDDAKDYSPGWTPLNQSHMTEQCIEAGDKYDIWKYRNSIELMFISVFTYPQVDRISPLLVSLAQPKDNL